jgi:hypothetical protein
MARFTHPANDGSGISAVLPFHGAFYSSLDQSLAVDTAGAMKFEHTQLSQGVSITNNSLGNPTRITMENFGVYNIQFSAQFYHTGGGGQGQTVNIWLKHNNVTEPDTNTKLIVPSNAPYVVAAWNFFVEVDTLPQWFEIFWQTDNANVRIEQIAASGNMPATPSVILTVNQIA